MVHQITLGKPISADRPYSIFYDCMKHLKEVNMEYFEHLKFAWSIAFASFIHGIFPGLFSNYVTKKITGSLPRYRVDNILE